MSESPSAPASPASSDPAVQTGPDDARRGPALRWWVAVVGLLLLALVGFGGYRLGAASAGAPAEDGADVGFARDMQTHHNQAVHMAMVIRDKTSDPTLRTVAYDIATSQQQQSGQMYGWLVQWGLPQTASGEPMAWMSAEAHGDAHSSTGDAAPPTDGMSMPGLASADEIRALEQATGPDAERQFLTLMIRHHEGGVAMAEAALEMAERREVLGLAQSIVTAQTAEITLLERLLQERS